MLVMRNQTPAYWDCILTLYFMIVYRQNDSLIDPQMSSRLLVMAEGHFRTCAGGTRMPANYVILFTPRSGHIDIDKNAPPGLVAEGRLTILQFLRVAREDYTGGGQQWYLLEEVLRGSQTALDAAALLTQYACADALFGLQTSFLPQMRLDWQELATRMSGDDACYELIAHLPQCEHYRREYIWRLIGWTIVNPPEALPCPELYYLYNDYCARHGNAPHRDYVLELNLTLTQAGDYELISLGYRPATPQDNRDIVLNITSSP
jgi:hypothetical protein